MREGLPATSQSAARQDFVRMGAGGEGVGVAGAG